jgi:DNA-binding SARP family transcriptional activator
MVATSDSTPRWPTEDRAFPQAATELLSSGQYERLAELLHRVQLAYDRQGDTIPAHVLVLARRICLACSQSQAEADWHQQACEEAAQREDKLRHQLTTLLDLVGERELSVVPGEWDTIPQAPTAMLGPPAPDVPEPVEAPSLWQRIQGILHQRLSSRQPAGAASEISAAEEIHGPATPPAQATEVAALSPRRPAREAVTGPSTKTEKQEEPGSPSLVVYCLGPFRVYQDDHLITDWESLKAKCILKYLVAHHGNPIVKDVLMDVFWPDAEPEAARRNLHQAVYSLRKTLRQTRPDFPYVWFEGDCYLLNPDTPLWLDFEEFKQHCRDGQSLEAAGQLAEAIEKYGIAESLYEGSFLEEDLYEDWPKAQRQHLRTLYMQMAERLTEYYVQQGDPAAAIVLCRKILSLDHCCEEAHRRLMQCYLAQGQRHLAIRQYQVCVQTLRDELDLAPSEETLALYRRITTG